jgi:formylglycine-generating enzyme required for sulfatase activity
MNHGHLATLFAWVVCSLPLLDLPSVSAEARSIDDADVLELSAPLPPWAYVSGGRFRMGSTPEEIQSAFADCQFEPQKSRCRIEQYGDEQPVREVRVSPFRMLRYEVSVAEYGRCVQARRCRPAPYFRGATRFAVDSYPVSLVDWQDARDYCAFVGGRLPSEAEFERAARGPSRRTYPWGNLYNDRVSNHGKLASDPTSDIDGFVELAPVGSFPDGATPEGIFDLAGNVAEWVWDRYAPEYLERDLHNPMGPSASSGSNQRVVRGGHFESPRPDLRGAARTGQMPTARSPTVGFRCVLPSAEATAPE